MVLKVKHNPDKALDRNKPLNVKNLSVTRNGAPILRDLSFEVSQGEIVGITGVNGSGKTTLVTTLAGTIEVPEKNIEYDNVIHNGQELLELTPQQRYMAGVHCVFEGRKLFSNMTVRENLAVAMHRKSRKNADKRIKEILDLFPKLGDLLDTRATKCSGGQQQIIAIARAIMEYPSVLILDEPTLGLSPQSIDAVSHMLKLLVSDSVSIVVCEQRASFVNEIADRKLFLERGKLTNPIDQALRTREWKPEIKKETAFETQDIFKPDDLEDWKP